MICTQYHGQYLTILCLFVYNRGTHELITYYHDSIHNREYQNFYYRDSIIFTIAQPYYKPCLKLRETDYGFSASAALCTCCHVIATSSMAK